MDLTTASVLELEILERAIREARFGINPRDSVLWGSPILAQLHSQLIDELAVRYHEDDKESKISALERWRRFRDRVIERQVILEHLRGIKDWPSWSAERRRELLEIAVAPFDADEADFVSLEAEI
jgi:hypothetical protein